MGYYIKVSAKSVKLRDKMVQFLKDHDTSWTSITKGSDMPFDEGYDCTCDGPKLGENLVYDKKIPFKTGFGYYYNAGAGESREWAYTLLKFAAARVGRQRSFDPPFGSGPKVKAPYIDYDGQFPIPIWTRSDWDSAEFRNEYNFENIISKMINDDGIVYTVPQLVIMSKKSRILPGDGEFLQAAEQWERAAYRKLVELSEAWKSY